MKPDWENRRYGVRLYRGKAKQVLSDVAGFPIVLTDPPYGLGKAWKRGFHGRNGKSPLWGQMQRWDELDPFVEQLSKANRCVIWGGNFYDLGVSRCWFVWDKLQSNRGADCELAWVKADLPPKVFRMSRIDAYVNKAEGEEKVHPAQKPLVLMQWCLEQLKAKEGELVCDPYMGSGTTGVACVRMGLPFVGVEVVDKFFEISVRRIKRAIAKRGECFL